jgi:hypothetical protein
MERECAYTSSLFFFFFFGVDVVEADVGSMLSGLCESMLDLETSPYVWEWAVESVFLLILLLLLEGLLWVETYLVRFLGCLPFLGNVTSWRKATSLPGY